VFRGRRGSAGRLHLDPYPKSWVGVFPDSLSGRRAILEGPRTPKSALLGALCQEAVMAGVTVLYRVLQDM
jgi:hypothetical protein